VTLEKFMIGAKGFRAREATANYKRRERRLVSDAVRAVRFANLHGNAENLEAAPVEHAATINLEPEGPAGDRIAQVGEATETAETETADDGAEEASAAEKTDGAAGRTSKSKSKKNK